MRNEPAEAVLIDAKKVRQAPADTGANHPLAIRVSLLQRGIAKLALGDVSGARCWFEAAAGGGNGAAATAMGKTFDPNFLRRIGAIGVTPDLRAAMAWYQKAAKLGDGEGLTLSNGIETETSRVLASNH